MTAPIKVVERRWEKMFTSSSTARDLLTAIQILVFRGTLKEIQREPKGLSSGDVERLLGLPTLEAIEEVIDAFERTIPIRVPTTREETNGLV